MSQIANALEITTLLGVTSGLAKVIVKGLMKVLHVIPSVAPLRGGPSQAVLDIVSSQRQQGIQAEIATTNDNGFDVLPVPLNQTVPYSNAHCPERTVPVRFFARSSSALGAVREFSFSWGLTRWLWQHALDYDLLHIHALFSYPSTLAMTVARLRQTPYIVRPIGQLCHWSLAQSYTKKQAYLALIEQKNLSGARALHFTSQDEQKEAQALHLKTPSFVVPHGLHMPNIMEHARESLCQRLQIPHHDPILLFLSRLHPKKGIDRLITALGNLKNKRFQLIIAGSGDPEYEAEIDALITQMGLAQRSHRVGFADGDFKHQLLQGSDLFVLPSHSENFGIVVLEALAAGLPVLTAPGVALSSVIQKHHLGWVTDNTTAILTQTLSDIFEHPEQLSEIGQRGKQVVQSNFSWPVLTRQLMAQYEQCLSDVSSQWSSEFAQ